MRVEVSIVIALIGCFVGLAGWLAGRDKRIVGDAEWRGGVNAKLDLIVSMTSKLAKLEETVGGQGQRLTAVEERAKSAHHRIDEIIKEKQEEKK